IRKNSPSNSAGRPVQHALSTSIASLVRLPRALKSRPSAANSSAYQPVPTPSSNRPPDSQSIVAAVFASWIGSRSGRTSTAGPTGIRVGAGATHVHAVSEWANGALGSQVTLPLVAYG